MPNKNEWEIIEFPMGDINSQRIDFSISDHDFLIIFTPVLRDDVEYLKDRSESVGFNIPDNSYDIKFDRVENFESDNYYCPPSDDFSKMGVGKMRKLGTSICQLIEFHATIKNTKTYFASAENIGLKKFYDRLVKVHASRLKYNVINNLGEEELDYAIKTPRFKQQN